MSLVTLMTSRIFFLIRIMCFYLSLDGSHFAVQPALTDRLGVALGRRIATGRHRGLVHFFAKQRSYTLYARGVAGCAICGLRGTRR